MRSETAPAMNRLWVQTIAAGKALQAIIALISISPQLPGEAAFKIGAACSLVFGPGAALLEALVASRPLAAVGGAETSHFKAELCTFQLTAVAGAVVNTLHPQHQPRAAAAFARSTGAPDAMLPWLLAVCRVLTAAPAVPLGEPPLHGPGRAWCTPS